MSDAEPERPAPLAPETVQDYPRPPALEQVPHRLVVVFAGREIAATSRGFRVLETHHAPTYYIPPGDVVPGVLRPAAGASVCEWKGRAGYFDVFVDGHLARRAAWAYPAPTRAFGAIRGHVAFYPGAMDRCTVAGIEVTPQPGGFYGGWVTPNLRGTIKGAPGTEGW